MSNIYVTTLPPVALAILLKSSISTLLTANIPDSTKYLLYESSIPPDANIAVIPLLIKLFIILWLTSNSEFLA